MFAQSNIPRVTNVNFSINVGTVVPSRVRLAAVPSVLIDVNPDFRGHQYFVVQDEIVIVDRSRRIVAVIASDGSSGPRQARGSGGSGAAMSLSVDEIREVQLVLIERGFLVGEADGAFGARTRQALIAFQRSEGLQVSGQIDTRTVTSLGLSAKIDRQGGQSGTASDRRQESPSTQGRGGRDQQQQPSGTTGQGRENQGQGKGSPPSAKGKNNQPSGPAQDRPSGTEGSGQKGSSGQQGAAPPSSTTGQGDRPQQRPDNQGSQGMPKGSSGMPSNQAPQGSSQRGEGGSQQGGQQK